MEVGEDGSWETVCPGSSSGMGDNYLPQLPHILLGGVLASGSNVGSLDHSFLKIIETLYSGQPMLLSCFCSFLQTLVLTPSVDKAWRALLVSRHSKW